MVSCGELTVEQGFDPTLVEVVSCPVPNPQSIQPSESVSLEAVVENKNSNGAASFTVTWGATGLSNQPSLGRADGSVAAGGRTTVSTTVSPSALDNVPDPPWTSGIDAQILPGSVQEVTGGLALSFPSDVVASTPAGKKRAGQAAIGLGVAGVVAPAFLL